MRARQFVALALAAGLSGCASLAAVNPDGGIVENSATAGGALKVAQTHCDKTGRTAKAMSYDALMGALTFECVAK